MLSKHLKDYYNIYLDKTIVYVILRNIKNAIKVTFLCVVAVSKHFNDILIIIVKQLNNTYIYFIIVL